MPLPLMATLLDCLAGQLSTLGRRAGVKSNKDAVMMNPTGDKDATDLFRVKEVPNFDSIVLHYTC